MHFELAKDAFIEKITAFSTPPILVTFVKLEKGLWRSPSWEFYTLLVHIEGLYHFWMYVNFVRYHMILNLGPVYASESVQENIDLNRLCWHLVQYGSLQIAT